MALVVLKWKYYANIICKYLICKLQSKYWSLDKMITNKIIFLLFFLFSEKNEEEEQEAKQEIKRRLSRKVQPSVFDHRLFSLS